MADTKISALPAASTLDGTEIYAADQAATSVGVTGAQIVALALTTNVGVGASAADTVGFYGKTPAAQTSSNSSQLTTNCGTATTTLSVSSSASVTKCINMNASAISKNAAALQEVINVLYALGIYATH